jgi:hypothetical protein
MDYRKPVALDLGGGYWKWSQYEAGGFYGHVKLLVRVNDKFNFNASVAANNFNQLGWAQTLSTDSIGMAVRQTRNFTQSLEATYLLSSNAYWSLNLRHAWNRVDPLATYHLNENGTLSPSLAYSDRTLNINIFNADLKYVLWFAPGREMNLLYRASLVNAGSETDLAYWRNIQNFSSLAADHVISLRVVYFLDYAELLK